MTWVLREDSDKESVPAKSAEVLRDELINVGQFLSKHGDDCLNIQFAGNEEKEKTGLIKRIKEIITDRSSAVLLKLQGNNSPDELKEIQKEVAGIRSTVFDIINGRIPCAVNE